MDQGFTGTAIKFFPDIDPKIQSLIRNECCPNCGFPYVIGGTLCPDCEKKAIEETKQFEPFFKALVNA